MKLIKLLTLILTLYFLFIHSSYAEEKYFFPESTRNEMKSDLVHFLKKIPQNDGQHKHINRVLKKAQYEDILYLIDSTFTPKKIRELSKSEDLFSLIEVLDILSYNLKMEDSFSNWYLSNLVVLAKKEPSSYLTFLLNFCLKSDGAYSEWFADPLVETIVLYPKEFSMALQKINGWKKICSILQTGSFQRAIRALTNYDKKEFRSVHELIICLGG